MADNMNYDPNHMSRLQQDAIRRAREMQAKARYPQQQRNPAGRPPPAAPVPSPHEEPPKKAPAQNDGQSGADADAGQAAKNADPERPGELFDYLMKDGERTLILFLLILLIEEKADASLIFALLYLLV